METNDAVALQNLTEDELITLAQENAQGAFEELMRRNSSSSLRLALSVLKDRQDAEDAVQESYWNAWRHIGQFHRESKFSTWMTRIVTNQCLMRLRKVKRAGIVYLEDTASDGEMGPIETPDRRLSPESEVGNKKVAEILHREIKKLPPLFRSVLQMSHLEELPIEEVASRNGISIVAAKSRLLRARGELKRRMERHRASMDQGVLMARS